jgi:hypothetical protein
MSDYQNYRIIVDTPSVAAGLGFDNFAEALRHAIESGRPRFAIGIFGPWGSGKTTLMQAVERKLDSARTVAVQFSAWRYEREEHLLVPLLDTIREALVDWAEERSRVTIDAVAKGGKTIRDAAIETASTLGRVITSLVAGLTLKVGLPGALEFSFAANDALTKAKELGNDAPKKPSIQRLVERRGDANFPQSVYHACFRQLKDAFEALRLTVESQEPGTQLRFVVFVDDLDRCLPQGALEVLEAIKLFFEMEGFVFVVGLDRSIVERFVEQRYVEAQTWTTTTSATGVVTAVPEPKSPLVSGPEYIKKIFQVPFNLAPVQIAQLEELIEVIATEADMLPEQAEDLRGRVQAHLRVALSEVAVNPRDVKRYINSYVMQMKITPYLNADVVLAIQTIKTRRDWKAIDDALATYRDEFLLALQAEFQPGGQGQLSDFDRELANLPRSFLDYVRPLGVARSILDGDEIARITEYLYSVEATTASHGPVLLDALRSLSRARSILANARDGAEMNLAQEQLRNARSHMGNLESFPVIRELAADIEAIADQAVLPAPAGIADQARQLKDTTEQLTARLTDIIQRTRALRRQNRIDSGTI